MIELINGVHHYPVTSYHVDGDGNVTARDLYPHRVQTRNVVGWEELDDPQGPGGYARARRLADHLNRVNRLGGNPLVA